MLDLNMASCGESLSALEKILPEGSGVGQMADSGTSNSSVLNSEDSGNIRSDEDSCFTRLTFRFSILKDAVEVEEEREDGDEIGITSEVGLFIRQLFPLHPHAILEGPSAGSATVSSSSVQHWVDLSFRQAAAAATGDVKLLHPLQ